MEVKQNLAMTPPRSTTSNVSPHASIYRASPYSATATFGDSSDWSTRDEDAAMALANFPSSPFRCMSASPALTPNRGVASPMGIGSLSPLTPMRLKESPVIRNGGSLSGTPLIIDDQLDFEGYGDAMLGSPEKLKDGSGQLHHHFIKNLKSVFPDNQSVRGSFASPTKHEANGSTPRRPDSSASCSRIVITPRKNTLKQPSKGSNRRPSPSSFKLKIDPDSPGLFVKQETRLNNLLKTPSGRESPAPIKPMTSVSKPKPRSKGKSRPQKAAMNAQAGTQSDSKHNCRSKSQSSAQARRRGSAPKASSSPVSARCGQRRRQHTHSSPLESKPKAAGVIGFSCNCKKSKCLKLYCECFAANVECKHCKCQNCHNNANYATIRTQAIKATLQRNANAFKPKIRESSGKHMKGCHCKKSGCKKKYCECFQAGIFCGETCKCKRCENIAPAGTVSNTPQVPKLASKRRPPTGRGSVATTKVYDAAASTPASTEGPAGTPSARTSSPASLGATPLLMNGKRRASQITVAINSSESSTPASAADAILPREERTFRLFGSAASFTQQTVLNVFSFLDNDDLFRIMPVSKTWAAFSLHKDLWHPSSPSFHSPIKKCRGESCVARTDQVQPGLRL